MAMMRSLLLKRASLFSNQMLRCNTGKYAGIRRFGMYVDHESENPTDPNHPDYIDPEAINKLAAELEEKGIPNSAGNYRQQAREFLFLKLRSTRQASFVFSNVDRYSNGQNGLPDEVDKSAY